MRIVVDVVVVLVVTMEVKVVVIMVMMMSIVVTITTASTTTAKFNLECAACAQRDARVLLRGCRPQVICRHLLRRLRWWLR